jgi:hypothetical protein
MNLKFKDAVLLTILENEMVIGLLKVLNSLLGPILL